MFDILRVLDGSESLKPTAQICKESGHMLGTVLDVLTKLGMEGYVFRNPVGEDGYILTAHGREWAKFELEDAERRKRKRPGAYKVPYSRHGNLLHYARAENDSYRHLNESNVDWRENEPFQAELELDRSVSGRSAKYVIWHDPEGRQFPMFVVDLVEMIKDGATVSGGKILATWMARKRGQNYGVRYFGPA
jgi:DNA-binding PadR family transcriptional regulator